MVEFRLLPGQAHDLTGVKPLLEGLTYGQMLADQAFDADWLREDLARAGIQAVILPKSSRKSPAQFDEQAYQGRHLVENFFAKLKEFRGLAMRCCKTDKNFKAFIAIAATIIRLS